MKTQSLGDTGKGKFDKLKPFEVIYSYTRNDALNDGVFVDITELAKEAGFKIPVAITQGINTLLNEKIEGQDFTGRAWDMFTILLFEINRMKEPDNFIEFEPVFVRASNVKYLPSYEKFKPVPVKLWAVIEPNDDSSPGMNIMLPSEY